MISAALLTVVITACGTPDSSVESPPAAAAEEEIQMETVDVSQTEADVPQAETDEALQTEADETGQEDISAFKAQRKPYLLYEE